MKNISIEIVWCFWREMNNDIDIDIVFDCRAAKRWQIVIKIPHEILCDKRNREDTQ
jgi:hypothetical protein